MRNLPEEFSELLPFNASTLALVGREGKHREFKREFIGADLSEYTKVLAAFANADGGELFLGISEKPRQIVGVDSSTIPDEAKWADRLREDFDPEIAIATHFYSVSGKQVFVVSVEPCPRKPAVCRKNRSKLVAEKTGKSKDVEVLREGVIYYRYSAQVRPIGFTELMAILEEREHNRIKAFLETLKVVERVGVENVGVLDLSAASKDDGVSNLYVSRETAKNLSFIRKGRFAETKDGASPAYVVLGEVNLGKVIRAPMEEEDKNLPSEAADQLRPLVKEVYGGVTSISPSQVSQLLKHLKLNTDERYCVIEKKLKRKYITRLGIRAVRDFIQAEPLAALRSFGSKAAISAYETKVGHSGAVTAKA